MLSKVTSSLKWYAGAIAYGHLLLLIALFPMYFFVLFLLVVPSLWLFIAYYMVYNYAQREGIDWPYTPIYLFEPTGYDPHMRPFVLVNDYDPLDMFADYEPRY
jgi:hypothetical protein